MDDNAINQEENTETQKERFDDLLKRQYDRFEESLHLTPKRLLNFIYVCIILVLALALISLYSVLKIWL